MTAGNPTGPGLTITGEAGGPPGPPGPPGGLMTFVGPYTSIGNPHPMIAETIAVIIGVGVVMQTPPAPTDGQRIGFIAPQTALVSVTIVGSSGSLVQQPDGLAVAPVVGPIPFTTGAGYYEYAFYALNNRWLLVSEITFASGAAIPGAANALLFENGAGSNYTTDAALVVGSLDPFGLPQIWDWRSNGAGGSKWRQGAWQQDGDPTNVTGQGVVVYGPSAQGLGPNATDGGYARIKADRIGLGNVINGVNGNALFYYFRADPTGLFLSDDTAAKSFQIARLTGETYVSPNGTAGRLIVGRNVTDNGSSSRLQNSQLIANAAQLRSNQYGANLGYPGTTGFKSRGAALGTLLGVLPGDGLWRMTAIGVAPDNASIPLAALLTYQVPAAFVPAGQAWVPTEEALELTPLAGPANSHRVVRVTTSEGETQTLRGVRAGGPSTTPATIGGGCLWSSDAGSPEGVVIGSPGDLYSDKNGGAGITFYVKESGIGTNTGWIAK